MQTFRRFGGMCRTEIRCQREVIVTHRPINTPAQADAVASTSQPMVPVAMTPAVSRVGPSICWAETPVAKTDRYVGRIGFGRKPIRHFPRACGLKNLADGEHDDSYCGSSGC